jgi:hypothetical protein
MVTISETGRAVQSMVGLRYALALQTVTIVSAVADLTLWESGWEQRRQSLDSRLARLREKLSV